MRTHVRRGQRGLSLIEVTIMLLVLMLLTSVLAPSIFDFVQDAQWVKVKEDCEVLAISVARLVKDVGPQLVWHPALNPPVPYPQYKLDLIISDGRAPTSVPGGVNAALWGGVTNWWTAPDPLTMKTPGISGCAEQFITNAPRAFWVPPFGATERYYKEANGPQVGLAWGQGWRGAYMSPPCGPDPWGYAYQINVKWLTQTFWVGATTATVENCNDVFCISPGKDGRIDTPFGYDAYPWGGVKRLGDDWVTVIAPCDP